MYFVVNQGGQRPQEAKKHKYLLKWPKSGLNFGISALFSLVTRWIYSTQALVTHDKDRFLTEH